MEYRVVPYQAVSARPHLMTPPVSQGFRYWESMSTCGTTRTDAAGAHEITGIVDLTRGKDHPTARLSGPGAGQVWHRVQELAGRARKRLVRGSANRRLDPFQGYKNAIDDQIQDATSMLNAFRIV